MTMNDDAKFEEELSELKKQRGVMFNGTED